MHDRFSTCALPQDLLKFIKLLVIQESYSESIDPFTCFGYYELSISPNQTNLK